MKRMTIPPCMMLVVLLGLIGISFETGHAESEEYTNHGKISAIDQVHDTVVVEVPKNEKNMTVGGTLVQGATLKKNNRPANLEDFNRGEAVTVEWRYTETGHDILGLYAR